ncbi:MAG: sugar ABC transporter ATP-binding protein [Planctomycetaceae bacterium]|nr:sugar ABC transporter ATP-binding protein [Planctomycetaceae bacterium]
MSEYILELKNITKTFPGVKALDNVHFQLKPGEIHALMGENGAGKSTFIKVITGVHQPNAGEMFLDGKRVEFTGPNDAHAAGIAAIYQHVTCYPDLSVTENIFMGHEKASPFGRLLWNEMHDEAETLLRRLNANFSPRDQMSALSVAQQQMVEIAKAFSQNARIIIMDEPTAALTKRESEDLYRITEQLRDEGVSIIFISHRFEDMYRLATRVTVFRDSSCIGTWGVNEITNEDLIVAMVGREITQLFPTRRPQPGKEIFRVENLFKAGYFADISFSLNEGEVLGFTGLVGAGRSELFQSIFGIMPYDKGRVFVEGREAHIRNPGDSMRTGIAYLPEDRQKQGLVLSWSIGRNISLPALKSVSRRGWIREKEEITRSHSLSERLTVKAQSVHDPASSLSGGNQQKVVMAKLLNTNAKILLLDEPTKGVDIGAKSAMYEIVADLADRGYGIILISSEMPEVLGMCDRILVMKGGRITGEFSRDSASQEAILTAAMTAKEPT